MAIPADPVPIETLLAHREWVRRVARALVADENVADDLEQDLWVGALARPPRVAGSARGWLAAALRHSFLNRRRAEVRRQGREASVARPERQPSTDEILAAAEVHKNVVVEVMRLPEPYRGTVLLRYFQGMGPTAIAARENVPIETVHTRLRRAREALRERLASHGDRRDWRFALAPLLGNGATPDSIAPHVAGGLLVKTTSKVALAVLLAALLGGVAFLGWRGTPGPESAPPPASAAAPVAPESAPSPGLAAAPAKFPGNHSGAAMGPDETTPGAGTSVAIGPAPRETPDSSRVPAPAGEILGRVLNLTDRSPVEGAQVRFMGADGFSAGAVLLRVEPVTTGADGAFRFVGFEPGWTYYFRATRTGRSEVMFHARVTQGAGVGGIDVLLGPGGSLEGRVTDARGDPVGGLTVALEVPGDALAGVMKPTRTSTKTAVDGKYRFSELTPEYYTVTVRRAEGREQTGRVRVQEGETAQLDFANASVLSGLLLGDGAAPIVGIHVIARPAAGNATAHAREVEAVTDEQGRFRLEGLEPGDWSLTVMGGRTLGFNGEVARPTVVDGANELTLDLGSTAEVAGRVESRVTGKALPWPEVQLLLLPTEPTASGGLRWVEGTLYTVAFADKGGTFRFRGLGAGHYRLQASAGGHAIWERDFQVDAGEHKGGVEVLLERSRPATVRFTVRDEAGVLVTEATHRLVCPVIFEAVTNGLGRHLDATTPEAGVYVVKLEAGTTRVTIASVSNQGPRREAETTVDVREGETASVDVVLRPKAVPR